jgi:Phytanoyl-CoA dioxygenase (PhyH)
MSTAAVKEKLRRTARSLGITPAINSALGFSREVSSVLRGALAYNLTGNTPPESYQNMVKLYCRTRGYSNDVLHALITIANRPCPLPEPIGILGDCSGAELGRIVTEIEQRGYYVFPQRLPAESCARLEDFATKALCRLRPRRPGLPESMPFNPKQLAIAEIYDVPPESLLQHLDVQEIASDPSVLGVAQAYLGTTPIFDNLSMWWSTTYGREANDDAAQRYHFDMDKVKWLKFFVYVKDVTPTTGPHCFIAGSHRTGGQPRELLNRGYARIADDEMAKYYSKSSFIEMIGPAGTIIAEDTRGFHKGKRPETDCRLVLELEFSDSLFGGDAQPLPLKVARGSRLDITAKKHNRIYSRFKIESE